MPRKTRILLFLLPVVLSALMHLRVWDLDLIGYHVWRQTQTQTVVYHFNFSDNSIFYPQRFDLGSGTTALLYEFPLYQWLIAQLNHLVGYSVLNTRVFTFVIFCFFLAAFYRLVRKFFSANVALYTNALICFSPLLYYYSVNPLPDIFALCAATWGTNFFFGFLDSEKFRNLLLFAFFTMVAALVKLPFILFGGVFLRYLYRKIRCGETKGLAKNGGVVLIAMVPVALWYAHAIPTWGSNPVTRGMLGNTKTFVQLLDYFQFNLISSVPELLTNYASCIFLVAGICVFFSRKLYMAELAGYFVFLFLLLSVYFLYELNTIEKTHDYYLMPFIPLVFIVVARGVAYFLTTKYKLLPVIVTLIVPLTAWLRIDQRWNVDSPGFPADYLYDQQQLRSIIPAKSICVIDHDESRFIALYYLKRYGYSLQKGELSEERLKLLYQKGARYLVSENKGLDVSQFRDIKARELYRKTITVYKLSSQ